MEFHQCICPTSKTGLACEENICPFNNCFSTLLEILSGARIPRETYQHAASLRTIFQLSFSATHLLYFLSIADQQRGKCMKGDCVCNPGYGGIGERTLLCTNLYCSKYVHISDYVGQGDLSGFGSVATKPFKSTHLSIPPRRLTCISSVQAVNNNCRSQRAAHSRVTTNAWYAYIRTHAPNCDDWLAAQELSNQ